jgi:hypothetical protein
VEEGIRLKDGGRISRRNVDTHLPNYIPKDRNLYINYLENLKTIMRKHWVKDDKL